MEVIEMSKVNFTYEKFCQYVKSKMSEIILTDEGKYIMVEDTQPLRAIIPNKLKIMTEEEALRYIYDNNLFDELQTVIQRNINHYHLDCPYSPNDIEQRESRLLRQSNLDSEVNIYREDELENDSEEWDLEQ